MIPFVLTFDGQPDLAFSLPVREALIRLSALSTAPACVLYVSILIRAGATNLLLVTLLIPPFSIIALGFAATAGRRLSR